MTHIHLRPMNNRKVKQLRIKPSMLKAFIPAAIDLIVLKAATASSIVRCRAY